jgi:non-canonical purine NTP pyrophosphatase (RdgB/HAM1 family)
MKQVVYVTGNSEKAANFSRHIGLEVRHHPADLDEIQTLDTAELVEHKARQAYAQLHEPVLVEDVTLTFNAWGGLPGPFVKFFVKNGLDEGLNKMCRMLDGFSDRNAEASCTFGYFDGSELRLFTGRLRGHIANEPRGNGGFGFDKIFIPEGGRELTAAELDESGYDVYYTTIKPFDAIRKFLLDERKN